MPFPRLFGLGDGEQSASPNQHFQLFDLPKGSEAATDLQSYLHGLFSTSYAKELDQDETIWRTLPVFGASLAVLGTALGGAAQGFPRATDAPATSYVFFTLFGLAVLSLLGTLGCLIFSTFPRKYAHPPFETSILKYTEEMQSHSKRLRLKNPTAATLDAVRIYQISQYAFCATNNRKINATKVRGRTVSTYFLWATIILTLTVGGFRLIHTRVFPEAPQLSKSLPVNITVQAQIAPSPQQRDQDARQAVTGTATAPAAPDTSANGIHSRKP